MPSVRARQVGILIQREVAALLQSQTSDPRLQQASITSVNVSPDLKNAKIYFSMPEANGSEAELAFAKAASFLRRALGERVSLKYVPRLNFLFDHTLVKAARIATLLAEEDASSDNDSGCITQVGE